MRKILLLATMIVAMNFNGVAYSKSIEIGWVQGNAIFTAEKPIQDGFNQYLKENGLTDWNVTYLDAAGSPERAASSIQDFVSRGADLIVVSIVDLRASAGALKVANDANIPVFAADSGIVDGIVFNVTTNNYQMSSEVSLDLINRIGGRGNLAIFTSDGHPAVRARHDTLRAILREFPDINVIVDQTFEMGRYLEQTQAGMQDAITRHGDQIDAVWTPFDEVARTVLSVIDPSGLQIPVVGMDGHEFARDAICEDGSNFKATSVQDFVGWGELLGRSAEQVLVKGEDVANLNHGAQVVYMQAKLFTNASCQ